MKRITTIALALVVLCLACAEIKSPQIIDFHPSPTTATKVIQADTKMTTEPENVPAEETEPQDILPEEVIATEERPQDTIPEQALTVENETTYAPIPSAQEVIIPEETVHAKTGGADDIPIIIEHAKTGYGDEEPEISPQPIPEPEPLADIQAAIDTACAYAANTYGVIIDTSLGFDNSAYRFPAVVPDTASQETLNAKAIGMVDYTFQQQMVLNRVTVEQVRDAEFHCNVAIVAENGEWYTYVFYTG